MKNISKQHIRQFLLRKQGLLGDYKFEKKNGILEFVNQVGCLQYDPIDICGKNAELVLQSRIKGFKKKMLYELLYEERKLIDYFDKNLSIMSVDDWKYFARTRKAHYNHGRSKEEIDCISDKIKSIITSKSYVCSKDLEFKDTVDWYWNKTNLSRAALETMYFRGELVIHHKKGAIKYYSLIEDIFPHGITILEDPNKTEFDYKKWFVLRRIRSVGLLWNKPSDAWLGLGFWMGISTMKSDERNRIFKELLEEGKIIRVKVEDIPDYFYIDFEDSKLLDDILDGVKFSERVEFLAPLDNMLWDRKLIKVLFDFDYKWEIYTPARKRRFGYYTLPILSGSSILGRIELVNNRKEKELYVKNIWLDGVVNDQQMTNALIRFADFNDCVKINMR